MELVARGGIVGLEDVSAVRQMDGGRIVALVVSKRAARAEKAGGMSFVGSNSNAGAGQPAAGAIFDGPRPGFGDIIACKLHRPGWMQSRRSRKVIFDRVARYIREVGQLQCGTPPESVKRCEEEATKKHQQDQWQKTPERQPRACAALCAEHAVTLDQRQDQRRSTRNRAVE